MTYHRSLIIVFILVCLLFTTVGQGYVEASSNYQLEVGSDSSNKVLKGIGIGSLIGLGIWGISRWRSSRREERYQKALERGKMQLENGDYEQAIMSFTSAYETQSTVEAEELLQQAQRNYQQKHYQLGSDYLEQKNWELAYQHFQRVKEYGTYQDVEAKYEQAYQQLREIRLKHLAVIKFTDSSARFDLGGKTTSLFTARLLEREPKFIEVVEREQLSRILEERAVTAYGLLEKPEAEELGNLLGVDYLVTADVISGDVSKHETEEEIEVYYSDDLVAQYTIKKRGYTQIFFRVLDVDTGAVVISDRIESNHLYEESYTQDESVAVDTDEEVLDQAISKAVDRFVDKLFEEFEF